VDAPPIFEHLEHVLDFVPFTIEHAIMLNRRLKSLAIADIAAAVSQQRCVHRGLLFHCRERQ
jgi:hypothetical protein